jgi:HD-GYP domain-containing protein (c-di-GMP phosphodiesterase class II)
MQTHAEKGKQIIDELVSNFGLNGVSNIDMLRNIAIYHHESFDGTGYPQHLSAENIPIEARITSVADIFDALTSVRPYKQRWSNEDAFAELKRLSGNKLDSQCVDAFLKYPAEILEIQKSFEDIAE